MCQKRNEINQQILHCRSKLSKIFPAVLLQSICAKIQDAYSKLFNNFLQIKAQKLDQLSVLRLVAWKPQNCSYHSRKFTTILFRKVSS